VNQRKSQWRQREAQHTIDDLRPYAPAANLLNRRQACVALACHVLDRKHALRCSPLQLSRDVGVDVAARLSVVSYSEGIEVAYSTSRTRNDPRLSEWLREDFGLDV
jgi:hypothetical protein